MILLNLAHETLSNPAQGFLETAFRCLPQKRSIFEPNFFRSIASQSSVCSVRVYFQLILFIERSIFILKQIRFPHVAGVGFSIMHLPISPSYIYSQRFRNSVKFGNPDFNPEKRPDCRTDLLICCLKGYGAKPTKDRGKMRALGRRFVGVFQTKKTHRFLRRINGQLMTESCCLSAICGTSDRVGCVCNFPPSFCSAYRGSVKHHFFWNK